MTDTPLIRAANEGGCLCQHCGARYRMDVLIDDDLWNVIRRGLNMLCPSCIVERVERAKGFSAFKLIAL